MNNIFRKRFDGKWEPVTDETVLDDEETSFVLSWEVIEQIIMLTLDTLPEYANHRVTQVNSEIDGIKVHLEVKP